jgi:MFS family permease
VFGRRVSFLASCAVRAGAFTLYFFADGFAVFLVAEAIDAIGHTLASGALDAWAVDAARRKGGEGRMDRLLARGFGAGSAAMIASGLAGAYLAGVSLRLVWLAGCAVGYAVVPRAQRPGKAGGNVRGSSEASAQSVPLSQ